MPNVLMTKKYLQQALREAGLPSSYVTLLSYERQGIIPAPRTPTLGGGRDTRFYTQEEIDQIVIAVRAHVEKTKKPWTYGAGLKEKQA